MRILLIEDDDVQARALEQLLVRASLLPVCVTRAACLAEARRHLAEPAPFDAVLLDLTLPDGTGLNTFQSVRDMLGGECPVIVFTAVDDERLAQQAVAEGAQDYLVKGQVQVRDLMRCVHYSIERHRAQVAARESEERFRLLVDSVQDYAMVILNPDGRVASWNAGAQRILGYTAEEAMGQHVSVFYPAEHVREHLPEQELQRAAEHGVSRDSGWRVRRDGSQFFADVTTTALRDPQDQLKGFAKVTRDMTEQQRWAEDVMAYQSQLRRLAAKLNRNEDEERRRLASLLHDGICQAMAAAQIKLDTLPQESELECGGVLREVRDLIGEAIELTRRMTFDLSPPVLYQVGLPAALVSLCEQVRRRHGIFAEVHCTGVWTPMLKPETRGLLYQAIRELVSNVIKHARAKRLQLLLFRRNPAGDHPGMIHVRVIDDGVGFDPSRTMSVDERAEGFGLFNLRERLADAQGQMTLRSEPGRGTTVEFQIPFDLAVGNAPHAAAAR